MELYVYLAGPITGLTAPEAEHWRERFTKSLQDTPWTALSPLDGFEDASGGVPLDPWFEDAQRPNAASEAVHKDLEMIDQSHAVLLNLGDAPRVSIGSMVELGYAHGAEKPVITVPDAKHHDHPFVTECSTWIEDSLSDAWVRLDLLATKLVEPPYA